MTVTVTEQNNQVIVSTTGATGPVGPTGQQGTSVLNGSSAPQSSDGNNGDFFLETTNSRLYGPKAAGAWPSSYVSLVGPAGSTGSSGSAGLDGSDGQDGKTLLNGSGAPSGGNDGDFWIDSTNNRIYGPKASGSWPSGFTSIVGPQGLTGSAGSQGLQGIQGIQGIQGPVGNTGPTGNFGGATFDYTFDTSIVDSDPGTGKVRFNNSNISSATSLYIDDTDDGGTDVQAYLRTIDDSTSTIKGHFKVSNKTDPNDFALFTISAATEATGYHKVTCAYVSGSTSFSASEDIVLTFARTGDKGDTGSTGSAASISVGSVSTTAPGSSATVSNSGSSGAATLDFTIPRGDVGAQGSTGAAASISVGSTNTGSAGSNASVSNSGTSSAATFDFTIPRGDTGATGSAATVTAGTTTTSNPGTNAAVSNSGSSSAATFDFTIPRGETGASGSDGRTILNGSGAPASGLGNDGDFYIDTTNNAIYGPKASGAWGSGTSYLQGQDGQDGQDGQGITDGDKGDVVVSNTGTVWTVDNNAITNTKILDDTIAESKLDIHAAPSGTNQFLGYTSNGMEWAVPPDTQYSVGDNGLTKNNFTDALKTKLDNIESNSTADQTGAEIKTAYESESDTNAFTNALKNKLDGIATSANNYSISSDLLDEDNMSTNSATKVPSQQSVKAYVDANSSDTTYTAGTGLQLSGTQFSVTSLALTTVQEAANESSQLGLTTQEGDIVVRTDENKSYVRNSNSGGNMSDFTLLRTPTDAVLSVNGNTGAITSAQIAAAVEAASDSNTFTDADHSKLNAIEASATADMTGGEIKTAYENESNTNAFTDAEKSKLAAIEASATGDQTNAEIRAAVEAASDSNVFTDADHNKLDGISTSANNYAISSDLLDEDNMASNSSSKVASQQSIKAYVDANTGTTDLSYTASSRELASSTGANVNLPEATTSNAGLQSSSDKSKLDSIETNADVTDAANVDSAGAVMNTDLDGKGEILIGDGSGDPTALTVGTNNYVLTADSNEATGVKWAAASGGGGGALEFVSKTSVSSSVSQVDITSLADDSVYLIIGKVVKYSTGAIPKVKLFDGSGNILTGKIDYTRDIASYLTASDQDELNLYAGSITDKFGFEMKISTKADNAWVSVHGVPSGDTGGVWMGATLNNTTDRISGIRVFGHTGTIDSGSQFLVYKYKES